MKHLHTDSEAAKRHIKSNDSFAHDVYPEQVRMIYSHAYVTLTLGLFTVLAGTALLWPVADHSLLFPWALLVIILTVLRLIMVNRFFHTEIKNIRPWAMAYMLGTFLAGCSWGLLALIFDPQWPAVYQVILWILLIGVTSGAIGSNSCLKHAFPLFFVPILSMAAMVQLMQPDGSYQLLSFLTVVFAVQVYQTGYRYNNSLVDSLRLRFAIQHMAYYDLLTDLPNGTLFDDRFQLAFAKAKREKDSLVFMYLDLDNFKPVNDNYGHVVGDMLLQEAATRMQQSVRESDTVARIGGDEFAILLPGDNTEEDAMEVAKKILRTLNEPLEINGYKLKISACIGIAIYPQHGRDQESLNKNADSAMYKAKNGGRNNAKLFTPNPFKKSSSRLQTKN